MKPDIKKLWVDGLRSGKYLQGRYELKRVRPDYPVTHCCLGVLCEIYTEQTGIDWTINHSGEILPIDVMAWAELSDPDPTIIEDRGEIRIARSLAGLNDEGVKTFQDIAQLIEDQL